MVSEVVRISRNRENPTVIESTTTTTMTNRSDTLSWCQTSGKSREEFTVIKLTHNNNGKFKEEFTHTCTAFQEAFREDFL